MLPSKCILTSAATLVLLFAVTLCRPAWAYSELIIFGGSLSDTGNLASVTIDFLWPYYQNRVSNGPLAVDVLAAAEGLSAEASLHLVNQNGGGNYAVDGAKASGSDAEDLALQLQAHFEREGGHAVAAALYVVMIGGNDLRSARNRSSAAEADAIVDAAVAAIQLTPQASCRSCGICFGKRCRESLFHDLLILI